MKSSHLAASWLFTASILTGNQDAVMPNSRFFGRGSGKPPVPAAQRPCLNCEKPHSHNNSFCSAKCCKQYRAKQG